MSALTKGFGILDAVTKTRAGLTFSEIVDATGLAKGTAHRLLQELSDLAAVSYDDATRRYFGGLALATLGASVTANYDIRRVARPSLEALHLATDSVTTLGIRNGVSGTYIDKIEPASLIVRLHSEVGKSFPLHCTAMGKVLLAHSDTATISKVTRRQLEEFTANTITDGKTLREALKEVLKKGFAVDDEEITRGLVCIAAPIRGLDNQVNAAMSCTLSSFDASPELQAAVAAQVVDAANQASGLV